MNKLNPINTYVQYAFTVHLLSGVNELSGLSAGYGNVAPKTKSGRVFCILYGLCGIPLCFVWLSQLGSFFGDRARRLSQVLIHKGVTVVRLKVIGKVNQK